MNKKAIFVTVLTLTSLGGSTLLASSPGGQDQVNKDRSAMKAEGAQGSADAQELKRASAAASQADAKSHQTRTVYGQKVQAREAAVKQYGAKDARAQAAVKEEAAAKQDWLNALKEQQQAEATRKAAIEKLHNADTSYVSDSRKLSSDENSQKHSKKTSTSTTH